MKFKVLIIVFVVGLAWLSRDEIACQLYEATSCDQVYARNGGPAAVPKDMASSPPLRSMCGSGVEQACERLGREVATSGTQKGDEALLRNSCFKKKNLTVCALLAHIEPRNESVLRAARQVLTADCVNRPKRCDQLALYLQKVGGEQSELARLCEGGTRIACQSPMEEALQPKKPRRPRQPGRELTLQSPPKYHWDRPLVRDCEQDSDCTLQFGSCGSSRPVRADKADKQYLTHIPSGGPLDDCMLRGTKPAKPAGRAACRNKVCVVLGVKS